MASPDSLHIPISRLWQHSQELYPEVLTAAEWQHLMQCEHCVIVLQVCYKSSSVGDMKETLRGLGIDVDLERWQLTLKF